MPDHPDGYPDALAFPEAVIPGQLPSGADRPGLCESDALAGARRDAMADAHHPDLPDVDAGKSADREPVAPELDDWQLDDWQSAVPA